MLPHLHNWAISSVKCQSQAETGSFFGTPQVFSRQSKNFNVAIALPQFPVAQLTGKKKNGDTPIRLWSLPKLATFKGFGFTDYNITN